MAELASTIRVSERHHDKVALLYFPHVGANCFDNADGLMAHAASNRSRREILIWPQVAAADTGSCDADKRIRWFLECCVGHVLNPHVAGSIHDGCTHKIYFRLSVGFDPPLYCSSLTFSIHSTTLPSSAS